MDSWQQSLDVVLCCLPASLPLGLPSLGKAPQAPRGPARRRCCTCLTGCVPEDPGARRLRSGEAADLAPGTPACLVLRGADLRLLHALPRSQLLVPALGESVSPSEQWGCGICLPVAKRPSVTQQQHRRLSEQALDKGHLRVGIYNRGHSCWHPALRRPKCRVLIPWLPCSDV